MSEVSEAQDQRSQRRLQELIDQNLDTVARRTDRVFVGLLVFQWLSAIVLAIWVTPLTWAGTSAQTHPHVWAGFSSAWLLSLFR